MPVQACSSNGTVQICSRAIDKSYNVQCEVPTHIWNHRGLGNNAWFRKSAKLDLDLDED